MNFVLVELLKTCVVAPLVVKEIFRYISRKSRRYYIQSSTTWNARYNISRESSKIRFSFGIFLKSTVSIHQGETTYLAHFVRNIFYPPSNNYSKDICVNTVPSYVLIPVHLLFCFLFTTTLPSNIKSDGIQWYKCRMIWRVIPVQDV